MLACSSAFAVMRPYKGMQFWRTCTREMEFSAALPFSTYYINLWNFKCIRRVWTCIRRSSCSRQILLNAFLVLTSDTLLIPGQLIPGKTLLVLDIKKLFREAVLSRPEPNSKWLSWLILWFTIWLTVFLLCISSGWSSTYGGLCSVSFTTDLMTKQVVVECGFVFASIEFAY